MHQIFYICWQLLIYVADAVSIRYRWLTVFNFSPERPESPPSEILNDRSPTYFVESESWLNGQNESAKDSATKWDEERRRRQIEEEERLLVQPPPEDDEVPEWQEQAMITLRGMAE